MPASTTLGSKIAQSLFGLQVFYYDTSKYDKLIQVMTNDATEQTL